MISETDYHGWKSTVLSTDDVELIIPESVGPRIISCKLKDGPNLFALQEEELGKSGEAEWKIRGGHRLWHAPEHEPRTYEPDNQPVSLSSAEDGRTVRIEQAMELGTHISKSITIEILNKTSFRVTHTLRNDGLWPIRYSAWAVSVMKRGGYAVIPFNPYIAHTDSKLPQSAIIPWTYTDLGSDVWRFNTSHLGADSSKADKAQKMGIGNYPGWVAYWQESGTFVKYAQVNPSATYPDGGSTFELFCCDWMLELESLSPLNEVQPGEAVQHTEYWGLFPDLQKPDTAEAFDEKFRPVIDHWLAHTPA